MSNWKDAVATAPVAAAVETSDQKLASQLSTAIHQKQISERNQSFAVSLLQGYKKYGSFSPKQLPYVQRLLEEKVVVVVVGDTPATPALRGGSRLITWFDYLTDNVAFPKLHLTLNGGELKIARAGNGSKTPGILNLTDGQPFGANKWFGRVNRDGSLTIGRDGRGHEAALTVFLNRLAADPKAVCAEYGLITGNCACCGRLLTNAASIELGIGPICAEKFGF